MMAPETPDAFGQLEPTLIERQLRELAGRHAGAGVVDDMELRHLVSVVLHGALLLHDLYSSDRIDTVYTADPRTLARQLVVPLVAESDVPDTERLVRAGRLPDDVRQLADKCLFDVGITRLRRYRGLDLHDLGVRAYRMASEILGILAEDVNLRAFFENNRLGPLPIAEEVTFLRQCAERFGVHADLLFHLRIGGLPGNDTASGVVLPVPPPRKAPRPPGADSGGTSPATAPDASAQDAATAQPPADPVAAGPLSDLESLSLTREDLLSSYERIVLFASLDLERLRARLTEVVVDQPAAIDALCDEFALYATGTHSLTRPPSYFFVGPTGVGKNYLVETLVRSLAETAGVEIPLLTIDGPNYTDASDINELRGSTRGFVRSDEEGVLAEFHERSSRAPLSVILVDEVEKAHPHLRKFFLGLMDRGTVTDNRGRALFFANSMLVFTSNLGFSESAGRSAPVGYRGQESRESFENSEVARSLRQSLSAEFVNRLRIIRFEHLSRGSIERIFDLELGKVRLRFQEVHGLSLEVTPEARAAIIERGYSFDYGARHLASVINRVANVEVARRLKRDDEGGDRMEKDVLDYLRQVRNKERAFDPREVRERVLGAARVRVPYRAVVIDYENGAFVYRT
jgi:hypothetical protein